MRDKRHVHQHAHGHKKQAYENSLASKNPEIKSSLTDFDKLYNQQAPFALNNAYYSEILRNAETLGLANIYYQFIKFSLL